MPKKIFWNIAIFLFFLFILSFLSMRIGVTWDESIYFQFSDKITSWFIDTNASLQQETLNEFWGYSYYHNPHPPFFKVGSALTAKLLKNILPFPLNYRFFHFLFLSFSLTLLINLLKNFVSLKYAIIAPLFLILQPRLIGHMLIGTTDAPIAIIWLLLLIVSWLQINKTQTILYRIILTVIFSIGIATKITAAIIIIPLSAYYFLEFFTCNNKKKKIFIEWLFLVLAFISGLVLMIAISPEKWSTPLSWIKTYLLYPIVRDSEASIHSFYFWENFIKPPLHYFPVMSAITYPVLLSLLAIAYLLIQKKITSLTKPLLIALIFSTILFLNPKSFRHDGVRQFIFIFPILGIFSWLGLIKIITFIKGSKRSNKYIEEILIFLSIFSLTMVNTNCFPHYLSYYNCLIGGIKGAEKKGLEMSYFFEAIDKDMLDYMNKNLKKNSVVVMLPFWDHIFNFYKKNDLLRDDIKFTRIKNIHRADYLLFSRRRTQVSEFSFSPPFIYANKYQDVALAVLKKNSS